MVIIGRNEGERLRACLESMCSDGAAAFPIIYVDSGSSDGSVALANSKGASVVALDMALPFTAARARNAGVERLCQLHPDVEFIHFIDGDCELAPGWLEAALEFIENQPEVAVVCGRRRERYPERSVYNLLCDFDWDGPTGESLACGGDSLMRLAAFQAVEGFRPDLIAGEEPELCVRLRRDGWRVWRLDADMTHHDAAMTEFGQWWRRAVRAGHAFAQGAFIHGALPERHSVRQFASSMAWGLALPVGILLLLIGGLPQALWLLLLYPLQVARIAWRGGRSPRENWILGCFLVLAKFAEVAGNLRFLFNHLRGGQSRLIEYK